MTNSKIIIELQKNRNVFKNIFQGLSNMKSKILLCFLISVSIYGNAQVSPATNYISLDVFV